IAGSVHLHHVDVAALDDGTAVHALALEVEGRTTAGLVLIVEGASEDAGRGGLADAAHPGEDKGMMNAAGLEGVGQGLDHGILPDQRIETQGPIFAGKHQIRRRWSIRRRHAALHEFLRRYSASWSSATRALRPANAGPRPLHGRKDRR